jgi:calcineurin-like phosphoesterase
MVAGSHTHVQTADARILSGGTAYVTDVDMIDGTENIREFSKKNFLEFFFGGSRGVGRLGQPERHTYRGGDRKSRAVNIERVHREHG